MIVSCDLATLAGIKAQKREKHRCQTFVYGSLVRCRLSFPPQLFSGREWRQKSSFGHQGRCLGFWSHKYDESGAYSSFASGAAYCEHVRGQSPHRSFDLAALVAHHYL